MAEDWEVSDECLFCRIVREEIPARVVHRDEEVVAFEDINPGAPTHLLVIPVRHLRDITELAAEGDLLSRLFTVANQIARERGIGESGYRTVFNVGPDAGQSVFHAHLHLLGGRQLGWPPG